MDVKLKGLPNEDIVQGYPGVAATWPRILATIEIRPPAKPSGTNELEISRVDVGLYRTDIITLPSKTPSVVNNSKREQSFLVTKQKNVYRDDTASGMVYGIDIPFILSLPINRPMPASISLGKAIETSYNLYVTITDNKGGSENRKFPVRVKQFGTLSTFGQFQNPLAGEIWSSDHLVSLEYSLPRICWGPRDTMAVYLRPSPNLDWPKAKKARLKRLSVELVQITRFIPGEASPSDASVPSLSSSSSPTASTKSRLSTQSKSDSAVSASSSSTVEEEKEKRQRICKTAKDYSSVELGLAAEVFELDIPTITLDTRDNIYPVETPEIPFEGRVGFTTAASIYSIEFVLILKARFSHAKDIETEVPVTISEFDHSQSVVYMSNIIEAAQLARYAQRNVRDPVVHRSPLGKHIDVC